MENNEAAWESYWVTALNEAPPISIYFISSLSPRNFYSEYRVRDFAFKLNSAS